MRISDLTTSTAAFGHPVGQFLHRDGLGDDDVADDFFLLAACSSR